jgi:hypothetical protein
MAKLEFEDWEQRWKELYNKFDEEEYKKFTPDERLWFNIRSVIDAINSGGIGSYYINKWFVDMNDTIEDLEKIEAHNVITMLKQVNELLPNGALLKEADELSEIIADLGEESDELLEEINEKFADIEEEIEEKLDKVVARLLN